MSTRCHTKVLRRVHRSRGSALLAVLWLSAALAAVGLALASTVRGETERASTEVDGLRCYYLAAGGVHRAALELLWSINDPTNRKLPEGATRAIYHFASGDAFVEILPEAGKLDVNNASPDLLFKLGVALGLDPARAREIAMGIVALHGGGLTAGDPAAPPSFPAGATSIKEIEELLAVKGVTPDIYYGSYGPLSGPGSAMGWKAGLADCLSVFGSLEEVDINTAQPAVMAALGASAASVAAVLQARRLKPIPPDQLGAFGLPGVFAWGGHTIATIRATARLRLSNGQLGDLRRTVAAMVKYMPLTGYDAPIHILRWYDTAWSH